MCAWWPAVMFFWCRAIQLRVRGNKTWCGSEKDSPHTKQQLWKLHPHAAAAFFLPPVEWVWPSHPPNLSDSSQGHVLGDGICFMNSFLLCVCARVRVCCCCLCFTVGCSSHTVIKKQRRRCSFMDINWLLLRTVLSKRYGEGKMMLVWIQNRNGASH